MNKMNSLDDKILGMLTNLDLIPEMINPNGFTFFGPGRLQKRTARIYTLICNISQFHETTSEAIRWLCLNLNVSTDLYNLPADNFDSMYNNIKTYIWDTDNKDEETGAFYIFDGKYEEGEFLKRCRYVKTPDDLLLVAKEFEFDIYETAELLCEALFGDAAIFTWVHDSQYEQPLIAAMVYAKCVSLGLISVDSIYNQNTEN